MSNNLLADLDTFVAVVDAGSFTAAARRLGRSKASVSRQVKALEQQLGATLLHRTTRSLALTDAGAALHERAAPALSELDDAASEVGSLHGSLHGRLRVSLPVVLGRVRAAPALLALADEHPQLSLDLHLDDGYVDVVGEGYDLAVRIGTLADSSLRARRLGATRPIVCAAPAYLERRGRPRTPADLADHECLLYAGQQRGPSWRFADGETVAVRGRIRADAGDVLRDAAVAGAGLAWLPDFYVGPELESGRLTAVLEHHEAEPMGIWAVYPPARGVSAKVRVAVDRLAGAFASA